MSRGIVVGVLGLFLLLGCKQKIHPDEPRARPDTTSALWAFAPANTAAAMVLGDGAPARLIGLMNDVLALVRQREWVKPQLDAALAQARQALGFDLLDVASWKQAGLDPSRGFAVFTAEGAKDAEMIMVVPVADRAALRKVAKGTAEKQGGRELDRFGDTRVCAPAAGRYLCGPSLAAIDAAAAPHASAALERFRSLPASGRSDLEWLVEERGSFLVFGTYAVEHDGFTAHAWLESPEATPILGAMKDAAPPPALVDHSANAGLVARLPVPMDVLLAKGAPSSIPFGGIDLARDVLAQVRGPTQVLVTGGTPPSIVISIPVKDPARMRETLPRLCNALGQLAAPGSSGAISLAWAGGDCRGKIDAGPTAAVMGFTSLPLHMSLDGEVVTLTAGGIQRSAVAGSAVRDAGSAETRDLLGGGWPGVFWFRGLDLGLSMPPAALALAGASDPKVGQALDLMTWLGARVYEIGLGFRTDGTRAEFLARVSTFGADPEPVRAAYAKALEKRFAGDRSAYEKEVAAIALKHPDSLVAKQEGLRKIGAAPAVAAIGIMAAVAIPAFMKYVRRSKTAEARVNLLALDRAARAFRGRLASTGPTPPTGACCASAGSKCVLDAALWAHPTWKALGFTPGPEHYYSYEVDTSGGKVTVRAFGDLDCDGTFSTFELGADGDVVSTNELE